MLALLLARGGLALLRGNHQGVVHDILGGVAEHLPDLLGERHLDSRGYFAINLGENRRLNQNSKSAKSN